MQKTSALYKELLEGNHWTETRLAIGNSTADNGYDESVLQSIETSAQVFGGDTPTVGSCVSREINVTMLKPAADIVGLSKMVPYVRLTDGKRHSEWLMQGVFFIDSVDADAERDSVKWIHIHGYDALLFAEQDYPAKSKLSWPAKDIDVVREISTALHVNVDPRTVAMMNKAYPIQLPVGYSCREVLESIAALYAGCFIMSETGELQLVCFWGIPAETRYLIDSIGNAITFGGDRILV